MGVCRLVPSVLVFAKASWLLDKFLLGFHQSEFGRSMDVRKFFHGNIVKLVELEAGMPGVGKKGADEIQLEGRH